jgi:dolichyl-phosphate beta-glucosyltransferase
MIGERFTDFTCGFKMYTKKTAEIIFRKQRIFDWAFDAELIYIALLHNLRIYEAPVVWKHHPDSRVRLLRDIVNSFYSLVEMRVNGWQGRYR